MNSDFSSRLGANVLKAGKLEAELQQVLRQHRFSQPHPLTWRQRWLKSLVNFLTGRQTLAIREKSMPNGLSYWIVYDPISETRHVFTSETAVRTWLEQRYYQ